MWRRCRRSEALAHFGCTSHSRSAWKRANAGATQQLGNAVHGWTGGPAASSDLHLFFTITLPTLLLNCSLSRHENGAEAAGGRHFNTASSKALNPARVARGRAMDSVIVACRSCKGTWTMVVDRSVYL